MGKKGFKVHGIVTDNHNANENAVLGVCRNSFFRIRKSQTLVPAKEAAAYVISHYIHETSFTCNDHVECCTTFASKILTNVFYNNKQKIANDAVRKDILLQLKKKAMH